MTATSATRHLVGVWNPMYADAMDATRETATKIRDRTLGVGCQGTLVELAKAR